MYSNDTTVSVNRLTTDGEESRGQTESESCTECGGRIITEDGEQCCEACGLILTEYRLDHRGPRLQNPAHDSDRKQTGAPLTAARHDRGLSTKIGYRTDGNGNTLSNEKRRQLTRLRREHTRAKWQSKRERNLTHACSEITRMCGALDLPRSIREVASQLYRQAQTAELIQGRSIETIATGCLYAACRINNHTRSLNEIAAVAQVPKTKAELGYRVINRELALPTRVVTPADPLPALISALEMPPAARSRARELVELTTTTGLANGRNPRGVAAACLYLTGEEFGLDFTQTTLADLANVSTVTLRARYHELLDYQ